MFCFKVTDAAVEQAKMLLTSTGPEPRTCLKQPISASDSPLPSELQIKESVEVWNNTRETNLRYKHQFPTLEHEKRKSQKSLRKLTRPSLPLVSKDANFKNMKGPVLQDLPKFKTKLKKRTNYCSKH